MRIRIPILLAIISVIIISGCTSTGRIINVSDENGPNHINVVVKNNSISQASNIIKTNVNSNNTQPDDVKIIEYEPGMLCEDIECPSSLTVCPDGFESRCENTCTDGVCPVCRPSCYGHNICTNIVCKNSILTCPDNTIATCKNSCTKGYCTKCEPECSGPSCEMECGECETLDEESCFCSQSVPCCGNGDCEDSGETYETCPADCEEPQANAGSLIEIVMVEPDKEWVRIENNGDTEENLTGWTINDTLISPKVRFTFPSFVLEPNAFVIVLKGYGADNSTHLFRNKNDFVWNNDEDTAVLIDNEKNTVSTFSYT